MYSWEATNKDRKKSQHKGDLITYAPADHYPSEFSEFTNRISDETVTALKDNLGIESLLQSQAQCFHTVWKARDVILHSRTGSGKTLAYLLPILERRLNVELGRKVTVGSADDDDDEAPLKKRQGEHKPKKATRAIVDRTAADGPKSPFLLIFVFSNELAVQTRQVIQSVYGDTFDIAIAGMKSDAASSALMQEVDVDSGDEAVQLRKQDDKRKAMRKARAGNSKDSAAKDKKAGKEKPKANKSTGEKETKKRCMRYGADIIIGTVDAIARAAHASTIDCSCVRAVVVDEVDVTLGPKFSNVGKTMKKFLKLLRLANGSLNPGVLLKDFRSHHYVLVGATIPNWVVKAGFLGERKHYYRLVESGMLKLPKNLRCYAIEYSNSADQTRRFLSMMKALEGQRVVVFGRSEELDAHADALRKAVKKSMLPNCTVYELTGQVSEDERITAIEKYNDISGPQASSRRGSRRSTPVPSPALGAKKSPALGPKSTTTVLFSTDVAARGIDFRDVQTVVMLSLPLKSILASETFIHRAGRTARVHKTGETVLMHSKAERDHVQMLSSTIHAGFHPFVASGDANATRQFVLSTRPKGGAAKGATPKPVKSVLLEALGKEGVAAVCGRASFSPDGLVATFECPATHVVELRKKLWKYDLREVEDGEKKFLMSPGGKPARKGQPSPAMLPVAMEAHAPKNTKLMSFDSDDDDEDDNNIAVTDDMALDDNAEEEDDTSVSSSEDEEEADSDSSDIYSLLSGSDRDDDFQGDDDSDDDDDGVEEEEIEDGYYDESLYAEELRKHLRGGNIPSSQRKSVSPEAPAAKVGKKKPKAAAKPPVRGNTGKKRGR